MDMFKELKNLFKGNGRPRMYEYMTKYLPLLRVMGIMKDVNDGNKVFPEILKKRFLEWFKKLECNLEGIFLRQSPFSRLPSEIMLKILSALTYEDVSKISYVNVGWRSACEYFLNQGFIETTQMFLKTTIDPTKSVDDYKKCTLFLDLYFLFISQDLLENNLNASCLYIGKILDDVIDLLTVINEPYSDVEECRYLFKRVELLYMRAAKHLDKEIYCYMPKNDGNVDITKYYEIEYESFQYMWRPNTSTYCSITNMMIELTENGILPSENKLVIEAYTKVGEKLSTYKSGKIPELFKIIPTLKNWDRILNLTKPECWSTEFVYRATKIFCNLDKSISTKFFFQYLLESLTVDKHCVNFLNMNLYQYLFGILRDPDDFLIGCLLYVGIDDKYSLYSQNFPDRRGLPYPDLKYIFAVSILILKCTQSNYEFPRDVIKNVFSHFTRFLKYKDRLPIIWVKSLHSFLEKYDGNFPFKNNLISLVSIESQCKLLFTRDIATGFINCKCRNTRGLRF
ncbi:hypothetical protein CHUAL_012114 [Chamberlinius hualienensis]